MAAALRKRGIAFRDHVHFGRFVVEFVLTEHPIAICCDGDFWQANYDNNGRAARETERLKLAGLQVYRFLGSQILLNVDACLDSIPALSAPSVTSTEARQ